MQPQAHAIGRGRPRRANKLVRELRPAAPRIPIICRSTIDTGGLVLTVLGEEGAVREGVDLALYKPGDFECARKPIRHPAC